MMTPDQLEHRRDLFTGSDANVLMSGDAEKILNLWRDKVGDPNYVPEDLSDVWPVQLGIATEPLNRRWYEKRVGYSLTKVNELIIHPQQPWAAATLDGFDDRQRAPVECKHVGGFEKLEAILDRYAPQAHWQMDITGSDRCIFSIIEGSRAPIIEVMHRDQAYAAELWHRATEFMGRVAALVPPVELPAIEPPTRATITYDMNGHNKWAVEAVTWTMTRSAAKDNEAASKALKALVPADAAKCFGHGVSITRNRASALTIREQ